MTGRRQRGTKGSIRYSSMATVCNDRGFLFLKQGSEMEKA